MRTKDEIRQQIRVRRAGLTLEWIDTNSKEAVERVKQLDALQHATHLACYLSKAFEVQTQRFIEACLTAGKKVCVPRHIDGERGYAWSWIQPGAAWRDGPWRIAEPAQYQSVDTDHIELAIVPAVAVDKKGHRLGHGGGNFDRLLRPVGAPHVALVFDFQVLDEIPTEAHDVPVNIIVTEAHTHILDN